MNSLRPLYRPFSSFFLTLGLAAALPQSAWAADEESPAPTCPVQRLEYVEADVFAPMGVRESLPFAPTDVSTVVLSNEGMLPVKVTIEYYNEDCLCRSPQSADPAFADQLPPGTEPFGCELLERKTSQLNPGDQSTTITNFSPIYFGDEGPVRIAYRVLVEYQAHYDRDPADEASPIGNERVSLYADFYRNLKIVDCEVDDGVPEFSFEERSQSVIQSTRFTNDPALNENHEAESLLSTEFQEIRLTTKGIREACELPKTYSSESSKPEKSSARAPDDPALVKIIPPEPIGVTQPIRSARKITKSLLGGHQGF